MKKNFSLIIILSLFALAVPIIVTETGCTTTQQTAAYKTLYSLEQTTTAAVDAYYAGAIKGTWSTNGIPAVSRAYDDFQLSMTAAVALAAGNSNAVAPAGLVDKSTGIINTISTVKTK